MDKITSDEKLLKILESTSHVKQPTKFGIKPKDNFKFRFSFAKKFDFKSILNLFNINKLLMAIGLILTLSFLCILAMGPKISASGLATGLKADSSATKFSAQLLGSFLGKKDYLVQISKRNIFEPAGQQGAGSEVVEAGQLIQEVSKDLKLVAVIWSSNPEVMIESVKENRTFLLKKQETFGQKHYKVKDISRGSVILEVPVQDGVKELELR
jgi:hypothetical protein